MEIKFEFPDGGSVALERQTAKQLARKLWDMGLETPGAITLAARIDEEIGARARFGGCVTLAAREMGPFRAATQSVEEVERSVRIA